MKHSLKITLIVMFLFFIAQVLGVVITSKYVDYEKTQATGKASSRGGLLGLLHFCRNYNRNTDIFLNIKIQKILAYQSLVFYCSNSLPLCCLWSICKWICCINSCFIIVSV